MKKTYLNWSTGKDAAYALFLLQQNPEYEVTKLLTTTNSLLGRVSMHGVRNELLLQQVESLNLPVHLVDIPGNVSMEDYNQILQRETTALKSEGYTHAGFGDILLEDLKLYREQQLEKIGQVAVFPLWKRDTTQLYKDFIKNGFKAVTVCINSDLLDPRFCGRILDESFLADLPRGVDPCGENGEFHTFVFDGPVFSRPIEFQVGAFIQKNFEPLDPSDETKDSTQTTKTWDTNYLYCDLLPG